ncbi:MAG: cell division FtsA domain-containing protein [Clostridiaceae bacterium]
MQIDNFVVGLDIGTQYIKASALSLQDSNLMYTTTVESQGIDKNGIADIKALGSSIRNALGKLEVKMSRGISSVFVCIQPEFVKLIETEGRVDILGGVVTAKDIDKAIDAAQLVTLGMDEEIIDILIPRYDVDGTVYRNPLGVNGKKLEIKSQLVTSKKDYVESLYDAVAYAKYSIAGTGLGTEAAASLLATASDKINGVFLIDSGANSTRVSLYRDDRIIDYDVIKLGGRNITKDISIVMNISLLEAEEIKKGFSLGDLTLDEEKYSMVEEIIKARIDEIMDFVKRFIDRYESGNENSKIVVYGGGLCGFKNIKKLYKNKFNKPTNFITSDIIRDDSVFNIQSSGLAYYIINSIHYKAVVDEIVRNDELHFNQPTGNTYDDDEFLKKYRKEFLDEDESDTDDDESDLDSESGVKEKLNSWFSKVKNKFGNK